MMIVQKGDNAIITVANRPVNPLALVKNVKWNGKNVWVNTLASGEGLQGVKFNRYMRAYFFDDEQKAVCFGEIKFTAGVFLVNNEMRTRYVLCEY